MAPVVKPVTAPLLMLTPYPVPFGPKGLLPLASKKSAPKAKILGGKVTVILSKSLGLLFSSAAPPLQLGMLDATPRSNPLKLTPTKLIAAVVRPAAVL